MRNDREFDFDDYVPEPLTDLERAETASFAAELVEAEARDEKVFEFDSF